MPQSWLDQLSAVWISLRNMPDAAIVADMALALFYGFLFGYERSYHGRAAGMRTYGLVCMVSAALTSVSSHPGFWLGGLSTVNPAMIDPTRTIQGIVTGIGFLGAGIIMKDGLRISGLTTAASIWAASAIGVLVGLELYLAAFVMTLLAELFVILGSRFDILLPSRRPISVSIQFRKNYYPSEETVREIIKSHGYEMAKGSIMIQSHHGSIEWRFVAISIQKTKDIAVSDLAATLPQIEGVESFHLSRARN